MSVIGEAAQFLTEVIGCEKFQKKSATERNRA
jgi:hypothetical protein